MRIVVCRISPISYHFYYVFSFCNVDCRLRKAHKSLQFYPSRIPLPQSGLHILENTKTFTLVPFHNFASAMWIVDCGRYMNLSTFTLLQLCFYNVDCGLWKHLGYSQNQASAGLLAQGLLSFSMFSWLKPRNIKRSYSYQSRGISH